LKKAKEKDNEKGFTLIELVSVMTNRGPKPFQERTFSNRLTTHRRVSCNDPLPELSSAMTLSWAFTVAS
jgi:hypothetical protein